jgi:SWI/SNF-related matrix-associated actin-dependent regulator 1 of chromatin subfamily A
VSDLRATLTPDGEIDLALVRFLGAAQFPVYRSVVASYGARYVPATKTSRLRLESFAGCLSELGAKGFLVEVAPQVAERLRSVADEAGAALAAGNERLAAADARLASEGRSLFAYQRTGIQWLAPRRTALLGDDMGLGKTVQALIALPEKASAVVVCPVAVRYSWEQEARIWRPDLRVTQLKGGFRWPSEGEIVIVSASGLPRAEGESATLPFDVQVAVPAHATTLVVDEAHLFKNRKANRTRALVTLRDAVLENGGWVWLLTGTPLLNRPAELWNVLEAACLAEQAFGSRSSFNGLFTSTVHQSVPLALQKVMLRRRKDDVLPDLPAKRRQDIPVNGLPAGAIVACDEAAAAMKAAGFDLDNLPADTDLGKLISGPVFELMSKARAQLAAAKIPALLERVESYEDAEEPLVVFSAHLEPLHALAAREGWALIAGETSAEDRGKIVERFQAGELRGVACTYAAGGVGITLTRSAYVLCVDLPWTPALVQQAEDRLRRIGQKRAILVERLIARHPLDERVTELLTQKTALIEKAVEDSAVGGDVAPESPAEALARAAQEASKLAVEQSAKTAELVARRAADAAERAKERLAEFGPLWDGREVDFRGNFRSAINAREERVAKAIQTLAALDQDRARELNNVGFNRLDNDFGHSLAGALSEHGRLSDKQWAAAERLANKYRRQVGTILEGAQ